MEESFKLIPIVCISGATASGKSSLAIDLALKLNGEIINADSVQVYKGANIGSAKVTAHEQGLVPHHLLSHVGLSDAYSAGRFRKEALEAIKTIHQKSNLPIIAGGTGMYLQALLSEFIMQTDSRIADDFIERMEERLPLESRRKWVKRFLKIVDPATLKKLGDLDYQRMSRALRLFLSFGVNVDFLRQAFNQQEKNLVALILVIESDRSDLYSKIDERVEQMFQDGLLKEVLEIMKVDKFSKVLGSIGYRHLAQALDNGNNLESLDIQALKKIIQRDTRRFAKRQLTWWRNQPQKMGWIPIDKCLSAQGEDIFFSEQKLDLLLRSEDQGFVDDVASNERFQVLSIQQIEEIVKKFINLSSVIQSTKENSFSNMSGNRVFYKRLSLRPA